MMKANDTLLEEYILRHIDEEPALLKRVTRNTNLYTLKPRMLSGHLQGRILKMFCKMMQPQRILEIGTFTGYSALCMAEALPDDGKLHTIEINDEMEELLEKTFSDAGKLGEKIILHIGDASEIIPTLNECFDIAFIDGNKRHYIKYLETLYPKLKTGGLIIADNTLWDGHVLETDSRDAQTRGIIDFNEIVANDKRFEKVILPIRDGMTLIRKL